MAAGVVLLTGVCACSVSPQDQGQGHSSGEIQPGKTHQSDGNVTDKDLRVLIIPRTSQGRTMKLDLVLQELNLTQLEPPEPWAQTL